MAWKGTGIERMKRFGLYRELESKHAELSERLEEAMLELESATTEALVQTKRASELESKLAESEGMVRHLAKSIATMAAHVLPATESNASLGSQLVSAADAFTKELESKERVSGSGTRPRLALGGAGGRK